MSRKLTDLEITKLCAEAMTFAVVDDYDGYNPPVAGVAIEHPGSNDYVRYDPLHDDAQAMALLRWLTERGEVQINKDNLWFFGRGEWDETESEFDLSTDREPNRAICECVVAMQVRARQEASESALPK